ncbi:MAG: GNAT family N-acetyltransferase [Spirochaetota bacterium]
MWRIRSGGAPETPTIFTERLELAVLDRSDAEEVADYYVRNRRFLAPWVPRREEEFFTKRYQQRALSRDFAEALSKTKLPFWIRRRDDGRIIGAAVFANIIYGSFRSCFLGYNLDEEATGKGFMTEALKATLGYVFHTVRLHRVEANVMPRNDASLRVLDRLGFRREGYSPRYLEIAGQWEDHIRMAILSEEFTSLER